jgi:predicted ribosome quality control (RQC) complex YloA/Tae2 family protein
MGRSKPLVAVRLLEYRIGERWQVLVGRSDADNEELSLRIARPRDLWFHVRGMPGSHVLLRADADAEPDRDVLKQAAAIAAYHSKARKGGIVAVSCAPAAQLSKPRGAPLGTVEIRQETVLKVRPSVPAAGTSIVAKRGDDARCSVDSRS